MVADFNKKGNRDFLDKQSLYKVAGMAVLVVILILVIADFKIYQKKKELTAQINSYQKQIDDIQKSSKTLKDEIANSDNIDYLEKLGYEQFDQTRPGETEYMFVKSPKKSEAASGQQNFWDVKSWFSSLSNVWGWIKNKF